MSVRQVGTTLGMVLYVIVFPALCENPKEPSCNSCHDQGQKLQTSAHETLACTTCHVRHEDYPHPAGIPKPTCGQCHAKQVGEHARSVHGQALKQGKAAAPDCAVCHGKVHEVARTSSVAFRKAIPDTCGMCHTDIAAEFHSSVHGRAVERGVAEAPVCTTCHGEHAILSPKSEASPVNPHHIRETCAQCHGNVRLASRFGLPPDRVVSFDASFHGMAAKAGSETVANCASCHGVHNILPSTDPHSTINPKNLAATCGKCHPGAGSRFALGLIHQLPGGTEPKAIRWARAFYLFVIPLTIGLMFLHNLGDWVRKLAQRRFQKDVQVAASAGSYRDGDTPAREEIQMYGFERFQHVLLLVSFTVLVWTGFALKYPSGWWARPLLGWESRWPVRGMIHRLAAIVFMIVAAMHLTSLITSKHLRRHWQELWPRRSDVREAVLNFAYNLGLRSRRPQIPAHGYIEKAEYWAVVWGAVVMIVTGLILWAHRFVLAWLPKSVLDFATAVHFYEAVLAALAIVVWHLYSVIFDPDVYPMETAWLTGRSVKRRELERLEESPTDSAAEEQRTPDGSPQG